MKCHSAQYVQQKIERFIYVQEVKLLCTRHVKAQRGSTAPLIRSLGARWRGVVNVMPRPLYPTPPHQERSLVQIVQQAEWAGSIVGLDVFGCEKMSVRDSNSGTFSP